MLAVLAGVPWKKIGLWLLKANAWLMAALSPLGAFGVLIVAIIDSSSIPLPLDAMVVEYVVRDHAKFLIYCFFAGLGAAIGSLLPYYLGRAGGEFFLLKRINRARYEQLRDRFEKQEFLAIVIPALMPPPFPVKIFEIAAGVFEMKPLWFFMAIFVGKFFRFLFWAIITLTYGPAILHTITRTMRAHLSYVTGVGGIILLLLLAYVLRKVFDRRRGTSLPVEEE